ncbi:MAG: hypothetical protein M1814_002217 [Vezdaea aestivalis]|nr:MAG: hypothetical protein M1814_002217 [Vezdaea aestivalis]
MVPLRRISRLVSLFFAFTLVQYDLARAVSPERLESLLDSAESLSIGDAEEQASLPGAQQDEIEPWVENEPNPQPDLPLSYSAHSEHLVYGEILADPGHVSLGQPGSLQNGGVNPLRDIYCRSVQLPWWYDSDILPNGLPVTSYGRSLKRLCAAPPAGLHQANLGGYCRHADVGLPVVDFDLRSANGDLLQDRRLRVYCRMFCSCMFGPQQSTTQPRDLIVIAGQGSNVLGFTVGATGPFMVLRGPAGSRNIVPVSRVGGVGNGQGAVRSGWNCRGEGEQGECKASGVVVTDPELSSPRCERKECVELKCSTGQGSGCRCVVTDYDVKSGLFLAAACAVVEGVRRGGKGIGGRRRGKRDFQMTGCACNGTYVSEKCCGTENGLIWEAPGLKMGEVARELW